MGPEWNVGWQDFWQHVVAWLSYWLALMLQVSSKAGHEPHRFTFALYWTKCYVAQNLGQHFLPDHHRCAWSRG